MNPINNFQREEDNILERERAEVCVQGKYTVACYSLSAVCPLGCWLAHLEEGRAKRVKLGHCWCTTANCNCTQAKEQKEQKAFTPGGCGGGWGGIKVWAGSQPTHWSSAAAQAPGGSVIVIMQVIFVCHDYWVTIVDVPSSDLCGSLSRRLNIWSALASVWYWWLRGHWCSWLRTWHRPRPWWTPCGPPQGPM